MGVAEYPCNPSEEKIVGMAHLTLIFTHKRKKSIYSSRRRSMKQFMGRRSKKNLTCQITARCLLGRVFSLTNCDKSKSI